MNLRQLSILIAVVGLYFAWRSSKILEATQTTGGAGTTTTTGTNAGFWGTVENPGPGNDPIVGSPTAIRPILVTSY